MKMTAEQLGAVLSLHPHTILRMAKRGQIPYYSVGERVVRFDHDEVLQAIRRPARDDEPIKRKRGRPRKVTVEKDFFPDLK